MRTNAEKQLPIILPNQPNLQTSSKFMKNMPITIFLLLAATTLALRALPAAEFHVAITGSDASPGTPAAPLRTIQRAADLAQPGDTVTVHAGVYREYVNPPRGGESDTKRIVYRAAPGEWVEINGSEVVKNWVKVQEASGSATLSQHHFLAASIPTPTSSRAIGSSPMAPANITPAPCISTATGWARRPSLTRF